MESGRVEEASATEVVLHPNGYPQLVYDIELPNGRLLEEEDIVKKVPVLDKNGIQSEKVEIYAKWYEDGTKVKEQRSYFGDNGIEITIVGEGQDIGYDVENRYRITNKVQDVLAKLINGEYEIDGYSEKPFSKKEVSSIQKSGRRYKPNDVVLIEDSRFAGDPDQANNLTQDIGEIHHIILNAFKGMGDVKTSISS